MAKVSIYVGRKLAVEVLFEDDWISGAFLYKLSPREGTLYPIISNRVRYDYPIAPTDNFACKINREFYLEDQNVDLSNQ